MTNTISRRTPQTCFAPLSLAAILVGACMGLVGASASAQVATFRLQDSTNLAPLPYQIYITGFSTGGPYILQTDGSWQTPPLAPTTQTLPCYRFPQDIQQVQINSGQTAISARVYYFIVTDLTKFAACNPASGNNGLFGDPNGFTYTYTVANGLAVTAPPAADVINKIFPAWTFSEIGASATNATIDLSQVDFFAFPMNTQAVVNTATPPNPSQIGNPLGLANPGEAVNHASVRDSYAKYADALALAAGGACSNPLPPPVCEYKKLLQDITTPNSSVPLYVIQNPGGYVTTNTASPLSTVFDGVIGTLWGPSAPTLTINSGGSFGTTVAQDVFTSSIVTINYPSAVALPAYPIRAMKFVGMNTGYIAYVFNPIDYQNGCSGGQIAPVYCSSPSTTGFQVFGAAGALGGSVNNDNYTVLQAAGLLSSGATVAGDYNQLVARLGFLLSSAMNRGVALVNCTGQQTWQCWQNETYWYPTAISATFPDITQNLFSFWMHTATIQGTPMFHRPPGAVQSASGAPGSGKTMGMAYGFAADENPTPPATSPAQPEVPSKLDQTVVYGTSGTITFGPWVTPLSTPTLSVVVVPGTGGIVTSSPAGITCDPTCSHAFAAGTPVTLTATPASGWIFTQWSGACTGTATTCSVTVSSTTNVFATFTQIAPTSFGLNVVVSGPGTVTSAPPGINCGVSCSAAFAANSVVTLTAIPLAGATFASWTGACAGSGATCQVTMSAARNVGATFILPSQVTLTVQGGVGGIVTTVPAGINCGTTCVAGFALGTQVSVVATPSPGFRFAGWAGACTGTNTCDLTMDGNKSVSAAFTSVPAGQYALTVVDFGSGTVVSSPPGIACGTVCATVFPAGTLVTLTATPGPGYAFSGWGGACTGLGACVVLMDNIQTVDATFVPNAIAPTEPIPTLSQWALILLCALIALAAAARRGRGARA